MATDLERLVVQLSADIKQYENALQRANGQTNAQARAIERRFKAMNKNIGTDFGAMFKAFGAGVSIAGAQQLIDASTRITNSLKVAGLEGDNLTQVYDKLFLSAQKNAVPLESLVDLYSRLSLVQKELNVSGDELTSFTDNIGVAFRVSGKSAEEASGALLQLSQALGGGVVRAEEFNSIQAGALPILQAVASGITEAGGSVAKLRQLVIEGRVSSEAFFRGFEAGAGTLQDKLGGSVLTVSQSLTQLRNVMIDAAGTLDKAAGASKLAAEFLTSLAEAIKYVAQQGPDFVSGLQPVADFLNNLNARAQALGASLRELVMGSPGTRITISKSPPTGIGSDARFPVVAAPKPISLADYATGGTKATKPVRATADSRFDQDVQAVRDRTTALAAEQQMLGLTAVEQEKRRMALELEQQALADLREEARRKGETDLASIELSAEQRQAIDEVTQAYADQASALQLAQDALDAAKDITRDVFGGLISDLRQGASFADALTNALTRLQDRLLDMALDMAINKLFQGLGGALGGPATGGYFGTSGYTNNLAYGGPRATGGAISGPGTGTSDTAGLFALSDGEYVVRAAQAKKHRALLDAINYGTGKVTAMAAGGSVGRWGGGSGGGASRTEVIINPPSGTEPRERREQSQSGGVNLEKVVIDIVAKGTASGKLDSANQARFGMRPMKRRN